MRNGEEFVKLIDIPHAAEVIAERFDNALELMGNDSVVYGGAIRDLVAGMPIAGDLDIAVNHYGYHAVLGEFTTSSKWTKVAVDGRRPKAEPRPFADSGGKGASLTLKASYGSSRNDDYRRISPISNVVTFETFDKARVQIIRVKAAPNNISDPLGIVLRLAREADLRCCSLAMNTLGKIFELVDGAYADCIKRVLRVNDIKDESRFGKIEERIEKLENRGWKSEINITKVKAKIKRMQLERAKREKEFFDKMRLNRKKSRKKHNIDRYVGIAPAPGGKVEIVVSRELGPKMGMNVSEAVNKFAKMHYLDITEVGRNARTMKYCVPDKQIADHVKKYLEGKLEDRPAKKRLKSPAEAGWKEYNIEVKSVDLADIETAVVDAPTDEQSVDDQPVEHSREYITRPATADPVAADGDFDGDRESVEQDRPESSDSPRTYRNAEVPSDYYINYGRVEERAKTTSTKAAVSEMERMSRKFSKTIGKSKGEAATFFAEAFPTIKPKTVGLKPQRRTKRKNRGGRR